MDPLNTSGPTSGAAEAQKLDMILVTGVTGAGKSYFINQLAGREVVEEGRDLKSCKPTKAFVTPNLFSTTITNNAPPQGTQKCRMIPLSVGASKCLLIDTPGFDDTHRSDSEILAEIAQLLAVQYKSGIKLKGIIYIHRISDIKYTGSAVNTFEIFRRLCGDEALGNVMLVTSHWNKVTRSEGSDRERQLRSDFWSYMLMRGSKLSRFHGDRDSARGLVSQILMNDPVVLALQREIIDQGLDLNKTEAGSYVGKGLGDRQDRYQSELRTIKGRLAEPQVSPQEKRQLEQDRDKAINHLAAQENQAQILGQNVQSQVAQKTKWKRNLFARTVAATIPVCLEIMASLIGFDGLFDFESWLDFDEY